MLKSILDIKKYHQDPVVSVLIPVYNGEKYLSECLDSILNQTLNDIEIICVDDCSTDDSLLILRDYAQQDERMRVYRSEVNSGVDTVLNHALGLVRGRYVQMIGDDDMLEPEALDILVREAEWLELDIVMYEKKVIYEEDNLRQIFNGKGVDNFQNDTGKSIFSGVELYTEMIRKGYYRPECYMLCRYDFLQKNCIRFEEDMERPYGDHVFFFHAMMKANRAKYIPDPLYIYRRHDASTSMTVRKTSQECLWQDFRSIFHITCERMRILGQEKSFSEETVNTYIDDECARWIARLSEWYCVLEKPNRIPFKNAMDAYCYRLFYEKMDKELCFKKLVRLMKKRKPVLVGNSILRMSACRVFDVPESEYILFDDVQFVNQLQNIEKDLFLVFFTSYYVLCKKQLEECLSLEENMDFIDGRPLLY